MRDKHSTPEFPCQTFDFHFETYSFYRYFLSPLKTAMDQQNVDSHSHHLLVLRLLRYPWLVPP